MFRGGARCGAGGDPVPNAGDRALGLLPAELFGAVATARRLGDRRDRAALRRAERSRVPSVCAQRGRRPPLGGPRHARSAASDRRARARGRDRRDQLRRGEPRADDRSAPREGRRDRGVVAPLEVDDPTGDADLLVLGWGSTAGSIRAAIRRARDGGEKVAHAHLRWLNPMPVNTGDVVRRYRRVLIPEINEGQLALLIRARFLIDARSFTRVQGRPMWADELDDAIEEALRG